MKVSVYQIATVSKYVGEVEVPEGADAQDVVSEWLYSGAGEADGMDSLCHYCADSVGELGDAEVEVYDEDNNLVYSEVYGHEKTNIIADLNQRIETAKDHISALKNAGPIYTVLEVPEDWFDALLNILEGKK